MMAIDTSDEPEKKFTYVPPPRRSPFEEIEGLEEILKKEREESTKNDPYLKKLANGKREKVVPIPVGLKIV